MKKTTLILIIGIVLGTFILVLYKNNYIPSLISKIKDLFQDDIQNLKNSNFLNNKNAIYLDSLGILWIVTIDKSGSMLSNTSPSAMAIGISMRLSDNKVLDNINFKKDKFIFFNSGYIWEPAKGLGNEISKAPPFDISFIHNTDGKLNSFEDKNSLIDRVKSQVSENNYIYKLSFVSQIRVFSIVKAIEFLKSQNETKNFRGINVITITDDADVNDQWLTDYKNLKKWAPNKVEEVGSISSKYIYNNLNGRGYGILEEVFADEKITPHIWIYNYRTNQSIHEEVNINKCFEIKALDENTIQLNSIIDNYNIDPILFFHLDSIFINNNKYTVNQRFQSSLNLELNDPNDYSKNQIQLYGSFQVQYTDSIWGEHYKKYSFHQSDKVPTAFYIKTNNRVLLLLLVVFLLFLIYWLIVLPNKNLFVIYSIQSKKYVIKRGFKHHWKKSTTPVLSMINGIPMSVICKKHHNIKTKYFEKVLDNKYIFLICSNYKIFSDETIKQHKIIINSTKTDIDNIYYARSAEYPTLLKNIYRKTLIYKIKKYLCKSNHWFNRKIGKTLVSLYNFKYTKYYYAIPLNTNNNISFRHPTLKERKFVIEYTHSRALKVEDTNQKINIHCLNTYYDNTPNIKYDVLICYGIKENTIFWNVLLPEYEKDNYISLKSVYNIFQFKQLQTTNTVEKIQQNLMILKKEVKKQLKKSHKIKSYQIEVFNKENPNGFEITEVSCPGYLYLVENTEKQNYRMLYSPFIDGMKVKKEVFVKKFKTGNSHLYLSFLPQSLIKGDETLNKKVSNELVKITENSDTILEIKNKHNIIFKNINTVI